MNGKVEKIMTQIKREKAIIGWFSIILAILMVVIVKSKIGNKTALIKNAETLRAKEYNIINDEDEYADENKFVKFGVFFARDIDGDGKAEHLDGTCKEQSETDTLFINIGVLANGRLEGGKIIISSANFTNKMNMVAGTQSILKNNCIGDNVTVINLKTVQAGKQELLSGIISSYIKSESDYSKITNITLTGTHIDDEGNQTKINKTVPITVDWYGEAKTNISGSNNTYKFDDVIDNEHLVFNINMSANTTNLLVKERHIVVNMPDLYGYYPEQVICAEGEYDESTHQLKIDEYTDSATSDFIIKVIWPAEMYNDLKSEIDERVTKNIFFDVSGYSICYNNDNPQFSNPFKTDEVNSSILVTINNGDKPVNEVAHEVDMRLLTYEDVGEGKIGWKKSHFLDAYDEENPDNFEYKVRYQMRRTATLSGQETNYTVVDGTAEEEVLKIGKYEIDDENLIVVDGKFVILDDEHTKSIKVKNYYSRSTYVFDCTGDTLGNYSANNFSRTKGILFRDYRALETDGYVRIYDGDTLIKEFSYDELAEYGEDNPYMFSEDVTNIKIETSEDKNKEYGYFIVDVIKEIDTKKLTENVDRAELIKLTQFKTNVTFSGSAINNKLAIYSWRDVYMDKSIAEISISPADMSIGTVDENTLINIEIPSHSKVAATTSALWADGTFLVKIPKQQISNFDIKNVTSSSDTIEIDGYGISEDDEYYTIKVYTKNTGTETIENDDGSTSTQIKAEKGFDIKINANISIYPITSPSQERISLWAYNKNCEIYTNEGKDIYDIDGDGSVDDYVGYYSSTFQIKAPTTFISTESVSNYNEEGDVTYSPNVADVTNTTRKASVDVFFMNNYQNTLKNLEILGKIPFEGNTYTGDKSKLLKSTYSTTMTQEGLNIPDDLKDFTTVYYSENEDPTKDVDDSSNGWKNKDEIDMTKVKTYLVVIDSKQVVKGKTYKFSYDVEIPENLGPNNASYACHTAYFTLGTTGGDIDLFVQPAKVGVRITKYFNLDLKKLKENTEHGVKGATYLLTEEDEYGDEANPRYIESEYDGSLKVNNLRINQIYYLVEQRAENYEVNNGIIKFRVTEDDNGNVGFEYLDNTEITFDGDVKISYTEDGRPILTSTLEDVPKVRLKVRKIDSVTKEPIKNVSFSLDNGAVGTTYKTDDDGYIEMIISLDKKYTLRETSAMGYFMADPIEFIIKKNSNQISMLVDDKVFDGATVSNPVDSDLVEAAFEIENEPIPTFDLQIKKVSEGNGKNLEGIKFLLERDDLGKSAYYTTDKDGIINIENLYQFVEGKSVVGNYSLKEVETKKGYILDETPIEFKVSEGSDGKLVVRFKDTDKLQNIRDVETDDSTVKMTIANKPLFRLLKIDSKTNKPIANVEFVIYYINENEEEFAKDVDGEYIGTQNSNGDYVVKTDEDGFIQAALPYGYYRIVEYNTPEGYEEKTISENFIIKDNSTEVRIGIEDVELSADTEIIEVNYIDDLVTLSNLVNSGNTRANTIYRLQRDLDFNDPDSYKNKDLMNTLTNENGSGFTPIGRYGIYANTETIPFSGIFDGQNHRIDNMYMKVTEYFNQSFSATNRYAGLFGNVSNAEIKNLTVSGKIESVNSDWVAAIVATGTGTVDNCHSEVEIHAVKQKGDRPVISGVANVPTVTNCTNKGNITVEITSGEYDYTTKLNGVSSGNAFNSYNTGNLSVSTIGKTTVTISGVTGGTATNCFNKGNMSIESSEVSTKAGTIYTVASNAINSYSTGDTSIDNFTNYNIYVVGSSADNSYYKEDTIIPSTGVTKKGTAISGSDMKLQSFVESLGNDNWSMDTENKNAGYPVPKFYVAPTIEETEFEEEDIEIDSIEDLVDLSNKVRNTYPPKKYNVKLNRSLDFESEDSYEDINDTSYGYTDSDGNQIGIREALTSRDYDGFFPIGSNEGKNVDGYGYYTPIFIGNFDGQGNTISNIYIHDKYGAGLFGNVYNSEIKNITVSGEINESGKNYIGGICGIAQGDCTFENCTNNCTFITPNSYQIGGIIGEIGNYRNDNGGKIRIKSCKNYGSISEGSDMGGIVGIVYGPWGASNYVVEIADCDNYGNIGSDSSSSETGGIIGYTSAKVCYINNCHNHADISGKAWAIGGLVGDSGGKVYINKCSNEGNITGEANGQIMIGGLVGDSNESSDAGGNFIYNSKNTGTVTGNVQDSSWGASGYIGGLIGRNAEYTITGCTNSGTIDATNIWLIGGLAGQSEQSIQYSSNTGDINSNTSGNIIIGGVVGQAYLDEGATLSLYQCYNTGNIVSEGAPCEFVGGIVGDARKGTSVAYTYNKGNITTSENINSTSYWGGIVGTNSGGIAYSYNLGLITSNIKGSSTTFYGGIAGSSSGSVAYAYNKGIMGISIESSNTQSYINPYVGGIVGSSSSSVSNSYNTAPITVSTNQSSADSSYGSFGYIGGIVGSGKQVVYCYNTGNITNQSIANKSPGLYLGGVAGNAESVNICYNTGNIKNTTNGSNPYSSSPYWGDTGTSVKVGGVVGNTNTVNNVYNLGEVQNFSLASTGTGNSSTDHYQVGGISGCSTVNTYSYNTGSVYNNVVNIKENTVVGVGPINGANGQYQTNMYLENVDIIGENTDYDNSAIATAETESYMKSLKMYMALSKGVSNWKYMNNQYPTLEFPVYIGADEDYTEITVENTPLKFDITTEVSENKEGRRIGGSITGTTNTKYTGVNNGRKFLEEVEYNGASTREIVAEPSEGYQVVSIYIDGNNYVFDADENGKVTIPAGYIKNVKANCNVVVRFEKIEDTVTIKKVNKNGENLEGAEFSIEQVDIREQPEQSRIGALTPAGAIYSEPDTTKKVDGVLDNIQNYGDYGFELQEDGTYVPNNTVGTYVTATSYFKIDLTGKEGTNYYATLNIKYEQSSTTYFYVTESADRPTGSAYRYVNSATNAGNIVSTKLQGGKIYYLHIMSHSSATTPSVVISDVNVYEEKTEKYDFEEIDGKYVSTNQGHNNRNCNSTVTIDTKELEGKYKLTVNAQLSSQEGVDEATISIGDGNSAPKNIAYLTGEVNAKDYEYVIDGGTEYILYMSYKNGDVDTNNGTDTFTINNIKLELDESDYYSEEGILTNSKGEILRSLNYGTYVITETKAPDGYILDSTPRTIVVGEDTDNTVEIENEKGAEVVAHYYLYGTGKEFYKKPVILSNDATSYGKVDEEYTTTPIIEINDYKLIKKDGEYVIPENATGLYADETTDVYYYYEKAQPEGTFKIDATKVSLEDNEVYIEGAEFDVYKVDGESKSKIGTVKSVGNGKYESEDINIEEEGTLTVEIDETIVPEGYKAIDPITVDLTIEIDEDTETYVVTKTSLGKVNDSELKLDKRNKISFTIEEPEIDHPDGSYKLNVTKVNKNDNSILVEDAEFDIYEVTGEGEEKTEKKVGTLTHIENGKYESNEIKIKKAGTINVLIRETTVPAGYKAIEEITGTIEVELDEDTNTFVVKNSSLGTVGSELTEDKINNITFTIEEPEVDGPEGTYKLNVTKVNENDNSILVEGAEFDIYEVTGEGEEKTEKKVGTLTHIGNGKYESNEVTIKSTGTINVVIKETKIPSGYKKVNDIEGSITIELDEENNKYVVKEASFGSVNNETSEGKTNNIEFTIEEPEEDKTGEVTVIYVDNLTGEEIHVDGVTNPSHITGVIGSTYTVDRINIPGYKLDMDNLPTNETGPIEDGTTVTYKYIELRNYELMVRYSAGKDENDEAKIAVKYDDKFINEYTTDGLLKIANIELTDLETKIYTIYETETPEYCKTIVSEENPGIVELIAQLNEAKNKYEFIANYEEKDGFKVIIDEENKQIVIEITSEKKEKYDLSLKKFISNIDGKDVINREPKVIFSDVGKITYEGNSEIEKISNNQNVTYTIRMYNESDVRAKGKRIIEFVPDGLVFVPDNETNKKFEWVMCKVDSNGKVTITENPEEADIVITDYLVGKSIEKFDIGAKTVNSLDVQAVFKVDESRITSSDRIIENKVQIMRNENDDNSDNDTTTEKLYVKYFDLSIEKYIANVKVKTNDNERNIDVGYDKKDTLVKVDVKRSEQENTKIIVTYGLLIKNVGEIAGYATEITDYIPQDFKLISTDMWTEEGNKAITKSLENVLLNPGESTNVEITFEWSLANGSIGSRINEAQITAYANEYDAIDVTEDNKDNEELLVTLKTGSEAVKYIGVATLYVSIIALGVLAIKKKVVIRKNNYKIKKY